jgi:hypothetical protein
MLPFSAESHPTAPDFVHACQAPGFFAIPAPKYPNAADEIRPPSPVIPANSGRQGSFAEP